MVKRADPAQRQIAIRLPAMVMLGRDIQEYLGNQEMVKAEGWVWYATMAQYAIVLSCRVC